MFYSKLTRFQLTPWPTFRRCRRPTDCLVPSRIKLLHESAPRNVRRHQRTHMHTANRASTFEASSLPQPAITVRNTYQYTPFRDTNSIRILTLQPGRSADPLVGSLSVEHLTTAEPYEAISYVWGTGARCFELSCDDEFLPLTQSIHDALVRLRWPDRPRRLWADQVCINQADIAERSQQVRLMNAIYKGSRRVLVWLGRDEDAVGEDAVKTVRQLREVFADDEAHQAFLRRHSEQLIEQSGKPWVPLSKLTKLSWVRMLPSLSLSLLLTVD